MTDTDDLRRGIHTLADLQARCSVEGKHWMWTGQLTRGRPSCRLGRHSVHGPRITAVVMGRAEERQPQQRWTVTCGRPLCLSPRCLVLVRSQGEALRLQSRTGRLKRGAAASEAISRAHRRSGYTKPSWMVQWAKESGQPSREAAHGLGVHDSTVRAWRTGSKHLRASAGMFSQLLAMGATR